MTLCLSILSMAVSVLYPITAKEDTDDADRLLPRERFQASLTGHHAMPASDTLSAAAASLSPIVGCCLGHGTRELSG